MGMKHYYQFVKCSRFLEYYNCLAGNSEGPTVTCYADSQCSYSICSQRYQSQLSPSNIYYHQDETPVSRFPYHYRPLPRASRQQQHLHMPPTIATLSGPSPPPLIYVGEQNENVETDNNDAASHR